MSGYTFEYTVTERRRARVKVQSDEGIEEAKEKFWLRWHAGMLDEEVYEHSGPTELKGYCG